MLFLRKMIEPTWTEIVFSDPALKSAKLVHEYKVLLQNRKKYPYEFETVAVLCNPKMEGDCQVSFALSPKTFNFIKRKKLFSLHHWPLELSNNHREVVKRSYPKLWVPTLKFQEAVSGDRVQFFFAATASQFDEKIRSKHITLIGPFHPTQDITPPWIVAPDYPPEDIFWRQGGEAWFFYVWLPYWESLSSELKQNYLKTWNVPEVWSDRCPYINTQLKELFDECTDAVQFVMNYRK